MSHCTQQDGEMGRAQLQLTPFSPPSSTGASEVTLASHIQTPAPVVRSDGKAQ